MSELKSAVVALTINTPDLDATASVYKMLGFKEIMRADWPFAWVQVTDGVLLIMLRKDPSPYLAVTYYVRDINSVVGELGDRGLKFDTLPSPTDKLPRATVTSPDGLTVSFVATPGGFKQPGGKTMAQLSPAELNEPAKYPNKAIGMFGELAQPVADLGTALRFWKILGFDQATEFTQPYPWAIVHDGRMVLGLHQTLSFSQPSITYFASDMTAKVQKLQKKGLQGISESQSGHFHVAMPGGQTMFIYSLGMPIQAAPEVEEFLVTAIGHVRNTRKTPTDDFWGSVTSEIELAEHIPEDSLKGILEFSHLEILYVFHKAVDEAVAYSGHPRGNPEYPVCGIFAQRKKDRPNHIGLCEVELLGVKGRTLTVKNLDAIDGTPIVDIKPVFREFRTQNTTRQPTWVSKLMKEYWSE
jgi:tRNA (adenine37-N6)-methyltransferase